jgi:hypothetical protein
MGLDVAITPRLDDGLERGGWRNALVFDPLARYGGYSYYDIMLKPIASALSAVMAPDTQVWFAMGGAPWCERRQQGMHASTCTAQLSMDRAACQDHCCRAPVPCCHAPAGEMSATVMRHPVSWTTAAARLKADIVAGRDDAELLLPHIKVGVSTNFNSEWVTRAPCVHGGCLVCVGMLLRVCPAHVPTHCLPAAPAHAPAARAVRVCAHAARRRQRVPGPAARGHEEC